jgi:hypothetical protein
MKRLWRWLADQRGVGWTVDSGVGEIKMWEAGRASGAHLKSLIPAVPVGNAPEPLDLIHRVGQLFAEVALRNGWGTKIRVQANNGAGDTRGVGVFTFTITTS